MTFRLRTAVCTLLLLAATACWNFDDAYRDYCASGRCAERIDAGAGDAGTLSGRDAGPSGSTDGGAPGGDAGRSDAGQADAGQADAGSADAGGSIAGCDGGLCVVSVYQTPADAIWALDGTSGDDVWVSGRRGTWFHYDGAAWASGSVPGTTSTLWSCAVGPSFVWAGGGDGIFRRAKSGGTWTKVREALGDDVNGLTAVSDVEQFAAGGLQFVARGDGTLWADEYRETRAPSGNTGTLKSVSSRSGGAFAVGSFDNFQGIALKRADGGRWEPELLPVLDSLRSVYALDATRAWAVGDNGAVVERGSNDRWMRHGRFTNRNLTGVWASSSNDVWVTGWAGELWHYDGAVWALTPVGPFGADFDFFSIRGFGNELIIAANHDSHQGTAGNQFDGGVVIRVRR